VVMSLLVNSILPSERVRSVASHCMHAGLDKSSTVIFGSSF
jgi:hypothetical protein